MLEQGNVDAAAPAFKKALEISPRFPFGEVARYYLDQIEKAALGRSKAAGTRPAPATQKGNPGA